MKSFLKKLAVPVVSAIIGAILGGVIVLLGLQFAPSLSKKQPSSRAFPSDIDDILKKQTDIQSEFNSIFNDNFFGQRDPFAEMKKMRKQMEKRMQEFNGENHVGKNPFDSWYSEKFGGGSIEDISKHEDDNFVYYDIKVEDLNLTSISTKVENGHISITGSVEKKDETGENGNFHSYFKSTFARTLPLPEGVDANKMETVPEKDKVTLKFPKLKI
jgi:HSP20 family molecular chaperone IbpA